jgi:PAS domain S-box-containing protein
MSWIDIVWPMMGAASLTLGLIHLFIWVHTRRQIEHLLFCVTASGVAALAIFELLGMRSADPGHFATLLRFAHVPLALIFVSLVWIVRVRFRAGRFWLACAITATRVFVLFPNFLTGVNLNFLSITEMRYIELIGGEHMYAPIGTINPWVVAGELANAALVLFLLDAAFQVWRRGDSDERVRALWVCGSMALFLLISAGGAALINHGLLHIPYVVNAAFLGVMAGMSYDLGGEVVRSAKTAKRLRDTEQRVELAAQAAGLGFFRRELTDDRIWINDTARALYAFDPHRPATVADLFERVHPEDRERIQRETRQSIEGGSEFEREYRVLLPNGRVRWLSVRGRVERDDQGQATALQGVVLDLSSRHLDEQRFRVAVEAAPSAMLLVDAAGRIVLANAEAERVFGYAREALIGQGIELLLPESLRGAHHDHRHRYNAEPGVRQMGARRELAARRSDGTTVPVEVGLSPIESAEGALVLASVTDVSERMRRDLEAAQQRDQLAHLSRVATLGELSGSLAHELNQPLAAILSNAQAALRLMQRGGDHLADVCEALEDIVADDKRAGEVIQRLRAMLKKEALTLRALDANALVHEVLRLYRSDLLNRGVEIDLELDHALPQILGDRVQLLQVLLNLLINACDAMEEPGRERRIGISSEPGSEDMVRISVCDSGAGIEADRLERVFDAFVTTKKEGLGLGLAVCRTIVEAHNGRIWAENTPGGGACFRIELPTAAD